MIAQMPTAGRIVHLVRRTRVHLSGSKVEARTLHRPAVVTFVHPPLEGSDQVYCDLFLFPMPEEQMKLESFTLWHVVYDAETFAEGTWHWPGDDPPEEAPEGEAPGEAPAGKKKPPKKQPAKKQPAKAADGAEADGNKAKGEPAPGPEQDTGAQAADQPQKEGGEAP